MKRFLLIFLIILIGCETNSKNEYIVKQISVAGEVRDIKVSKTEKFKEGVYDDLQAARFIFLNLSEPLKEKLSLSQVQSLVNFQTEFIIVNQNANIEYELLSNKNIEFLKKKADSYSMNLTNDEIEKIFEIDDYYAKLIDIID